MYKGKLQRFGGNSGGLIKWANEEAGTIYEGLWRGTREGKYGALGVLEKTDGKEMVFPMPTVLAKRLLRVPEGREIAFEYLGLSKNAKDPTKSFHNFETFIDDPDALLDDEEESPPF